MPLDDSLSEKYVLYSVRRTYILHDPIIAVLADGRLMNGVCMHPACAAKSAVMI